MPKVNLQDLKRFRQIVTILTKHGFGVVVDKTHHATSYTHQPEVRLRKALEELGGAFTKLGQMLALRPDLIPPSYCEELEKLQDNTPQLAFKKIEQQLKEAYPRPLETIFKKINQKAVASGSIAQVHKATLLTGTPVVIKIKKPNVDDIFSEDIHLLKYLTHKIKKLVSIKIIDPEEVIKEFEIYTKKELDFSIESKHLQEFAKLNIELQTPRVFDHLSTKETLVMTELKGTPLTKKLKEKITNRKSLANTVARSIMKQVFVYGSFHADPHPGNIIIHQKSIGLVDFGIVGHVDVKTKVRLTIILYSLVNKDVNTLTKFLLKLNLTDTLVDKDLFAKDLKATLGPYYNKKLKEVKLGTLFNQALSVARKYDIKIPREYILLGKTIVTTESVCELIYPKFDFIAVAKPFLKENLPKVFSSKFMLSETKEHIIEYADMLHSLPEDVKKLVALKQKEEHTVEVAMLNMEKHLHRMEGEFFLGIFSLFLFILAVITRDFGIPSALGISTLSLLFLIAGGVLLVLVVIGILKEK